MCIIHFDPLSDYSLIIRHCFESASSFNVKKRAIYMFLFLLVALPALVEAV